MDDEAAHDHPEVVEEKKKVVGFIVIEVYDDGTFNFGAKDIYNMAVPTILEICSFRAMNLLKNEESA